MMLVLTCALCTAIPGTPVGGAPVRAPLLDEGLTLVQSTPSRQAAPVPLALARTDQGAGDGDHSDHMGPMWIMMGVMMAVMMVGMGVYFMRHSATGQVLGNAALASPAQLALPVSVARGGGG